MADGARAGIEGAGGDVRRVAHYEGRKIDGTVVKTDAPFLHTIGGATLRFYADRRIDVDEPDGPKVIYVGRWLP